jgi:putative membrane-associated phospholipid phosphatase
MYSKKIENESYRKDRIVLLIITIIGYFTVFALKKADIINSYIGAIVLIFLYMYLDFNITNIYFTSKRTTFKIYIFMILEIMHFFMMAFSLRNIFIYFLGLGILTYLIITDEGKTETNKIYQFIGIYTLIKVIFALTWIFF